MPVSGAQAKSGAKAAVSRSLLSRCSRGDGSWCGVSLIAVPELKSVKSKHEYAKNEDLSVVILM